MHSVLGVSATAVEVITNRLSKSPTTSERSASSCHPHPITALTATSAELGGRAPLRRPPVDPRDRLHRAVHAAGRRHDRQRRAALDRRGPATSTKPTLSWIPNAYLLMFGGFLLIGGRMADLLGRRRVFTICDGRRSSRPRRCAALRPSSDDADRSLGRRRAWPARSCRPQRCRSCSRRSSRDKRTRQRAGGLDVR